MTEELSIVGKRLPRADAIEKVTGKAMHTSDIQLPGMLYAKFLRSPYAHARLVKIDTGRAEALPGVKGVLTHKNVPKVRNIALNWPTYQCFGYLLDETVHCAGEEVAVVAATTKEIAEEAVALIEVEYEVLPAVFDKEKAMKPDAPLVYPELGSNLYRCVRAPNGLLTLEWGDVEKGFAEADYIVEGTYESPFQHPLSPEPRAVVCQWIGDKLTCWASVQMLAQVRAELSKFFGIPQSSIRVISTYSVGGYGGKRPGNIAILAALLAQRTGRPVRAVFTREEDFVATHRRTDSKIYAKAGVKKDGTITALYTRMISNFGKDSKSGFLVPASAATGVCTAMYRYQTARWEGYLVITNIEEHSAMNALADPDAALAVERLMDEAAEQIGMDPVEFRLKNCCRAGDKGADDEQLANTADPIEWGVLGPDLDSFPECIRIVADKSDWQAKWKGWKTPVEVEGSKRQGIGIALGIHHCMFRPKDSATVKMNQDGTADVLSSDPEIGQGLWTAMRQVVAEALGVQYGDVNVILADTSVTPYGPGVFGSRGTLAGIGSAYRAALDAKQKLFEIAAERLWVKIQELEAKNRRVYVKGHPEKSIPIADLCLAGYQVTGNAVLPYPWTDERTGKRIIPMSVIATVAEVEVDTETGELNVLRLTEAADCGKVINPQIIENQIDLSAVMGNGYIRTEKIIIDQNTGVILNPNMLDYKIMTVLDMPKMADIQKILVEVPCPWGPFGAKGMAETAMTSQAPAIANAVYNAIGVRIRGDSFTPDRILKALGK